MAEFLPLCDVLFNVISLAGYFCDVVFDVVMGYALLERGYKGTFAAAISIVITSLLITQVLSIRWYLHVWFESEERKGRPPWLPIVLHCLQLGVLWRYARLLVPLELRRVKHQVRDLCMLRLVHACCEAAPMLLLQLHILLQDEPPEPDELGAPPDPTRDEPAGNKSFAELTVISASLSLFSVCWALASFSKNVRWKNVHRLVLTWLGIIFQFLWRLGTVSARVCALTVYGLVYEYWLFLVIGLHWLSMFLWLISQRAAGRGAGGTEAGRERARLAALTAAVLVLAYVNLHDCNHTQRMVIFYCVMCFENSLLISLWWMSGRARRGSALATAAPGAFLAGILFMLLYYRYFHVRRLGYMLGDNQQGTNSTNASSQNKHGKQLNQPDNTAIPGVFNCRFTNPVNSAANGRKKKKPTSFVPPPAAPPAPAPGPAPAFWRRPHPAAAQQHNHHGGSSENEGSSVGSRVNIQQKLQEKKQKQLAELRVIEEEIKQGKLAKTTPVAAEEIYSSLQRQPIPRAKTHAEPPAWPSIEMTHSYQNYPILPHTCNVYPTYTEIKPEFTFQNDNPDIKVRRYDNSRTFYENPANLRNDVTRTALRSPNYLENRTYESNSCASPRNVLNNSPGNYITDNNYESNEKPRIIQNGNYSEGHAREYSGYCENGQYKYGDKDEFSSPLQHIVQPIDNLRSTYNEPCNQYNQNCERCVLLRKSCLNTCAVRGARRCERSPGAARPRYCSRRTTCGPRPRRRPPAATRLRPRPHTLYRVGKRRRVSVAAVNRARTARGTRRARPAISTARYRSPGRTRSRASSATGAVGLVCGTHTCPATIAATATWTAATTTTATVDRIVRRGPSCRARRTRSTTRDQTCCRGKSPTTSGGGARSGNSRLNRRPSCSESLVLRRAVTSHMATHLQTVRSQYDVPCC